MNTCFNPFSLEGKKIAVTGASSGIGRSIAEVCAKAGAQLLITARDRQRLDSTLTSLSGEGHTSVICDLSSADDVKNLMKELAAFGKLDGMVLAAGMVEMWPVLFASEERIEKIYKTNLLAPIELTRAVIKKKMFNPPFSIVAIASVAGMSDFAPGNSIYGSGKAALASFMRYVALETVGKGVRVNTVSPGMTLTPMHTNGSIEEDKLEAEVAKIPMKRWGKPEEIAYGVQYLLSDAAAYVTGANIVIDGGLTI